MTDRELLLAIQHLLSAVEWSPDTLTEVAVLLDRNGYPIHDLPEGENDND